MRIEEVRVVSNMEIARSLWQMELEAPLVAQDVHGPGQFINIQVSESWDLPLRRPMSIAGLRGERVEIIYKIFGEGTEILSRKRAGDPLSILGPLGNWFRVTQRKRTFPILVGGGVGIAPIIWLHRTLESEKTKHCLIMGAVTAKDHFLEHAPEESVYITTDDGSTGEKGTVMPTLKRLCERRERRVIFACGPEPMLRAIHSFSVRNKIPCQMALESYMACGTGICQGCVIRRENLHPRKDSYHEVYSLVCRNGPVYSAEEIKL